MQRQQENALPFPNEVIEEIEDQSGFIGPNYPGYEANIRLKIEDVKAEIAKENASAPGAVKKEEK